MVCADAHPAHVVGQIINSIGVCTPQFRDAEVMYAYLLGVAFGSISASAVLKIAHKLLLLGVHRDDWVAGGQFLFGARIDELELSIAVRVCGTLLSLLVGLKTVTHLAQQIAHQGVADRMSERGELGGELAQALTSPP